MGFVLARSCRARIVGEGEKFRFGEIEKFAAKIGSLPRFGLGDGFELNCGSPYFFSCGSARQCLYYLIGS